MEEKDLLKIMEGLVFVMKNDIRLKNFNIFAGKDYGLSGIKLENDRFNVFIALESAVSNIQSADELNRFMEILPNIILDAVNHESKMKIDYTKIDPSTFHVNIAPNIIQKQTKIVLKVKEKIAH